MRTLREQELKIYLDVEKPPNLSYFSLLGFQDAPPPHHWASASGRNPQAYIKAPISPRVQFESREQFGSKNRLEAE